MKSLLFSLFMFMSLVVFSQEKKVIMKKIEKITKSTDESGKETSKKEIEEIRSGDEGSIEEMEKELMNGKKDGEFLTINKEINNGKETTVYTLTTKKGGEVEVLKWDGEGEMPKAIKDKMGDININEDIDGDKMEITIDSNSKKADEKSDEGSRKKIEKRIIIKENGSNSKVRLGVLIDDTKNGVKVDDVVKDGVADKAGINVGDIIVKINTTYIFSTDVLMETMQSFKEGDRADLLILRDGKEKKITVKF